MTVFGNNNRYCLFYAIIYCRYVIMLGCQNSLIPICNKKYIGLRFSTIINNETRYDICMELSIYKKSIINVLI